jgi:hypothetical protein
MNWYHREPTLDEMLSDSIIRAVMAADGARIWAGFHYAVASFCELHASYIDSLTRRHSIRPRKQ